MQPLRDFAKSARQRANQALGRAAAKNYAPELTSLLEWLEGRKSDASIRDLLALHDAPAAIHSTWRDLGPVAFELVCHLKPRRIVELGSYGGYSACVLGLALKKIGEGGELVAVDTWEGDSQAGFYSSAVFDQFNAFRGSLGLEGVIKPLRSDFRDASRTLAPGIDLLHIDGWHTFRAVRQDFNRFRPLLAPGATVLFHDVNAHFFGMRLFWWLLTRKHRCALVPYSFGLGLLRLEKDN